MHLKMIRRLLDRPILFFPNLILLNSVLEMCISCSSQHSHIITQHEINFDTREKWDKLAVSILLSGWFGISIG